MRKQQGFSALMLVLILIVLGLIGFTGWYVWDSKKKTDDSYKSASDSSQSIPSTQKKESVSEITTADPTSEWVAYSNTAGEFSLKHPKNWVRAESPELCNPDIFLVGADSKSVGRCASEGFGQMSVFSTDGDQKSSNSLKNIDGYGQFSESKATAAGVEGVRQTAVATGEVTGPGVPPKGTQEVKYIFYTNGKTYVATYVQQSGFPDALSDFDLMITKTLQFKS